VDRRRRSLGGHIRILLLDLGHVQPARGKVDRHPGREDGRRGLRKLLSSLLGPDDDPQWWLEGSSYPIRILDREKVQILVTSKELEEKWGEAPVFVTFPYGKGRIYHMISHFYLQRTETRTGRHKGSSYDFLAEKGVTEEEYSKYAGLGASDADLASVESAYASRSMLSRVLLEKKRQMKGPSEGPSGGRNDDDSEIG
jgi:hypothetical protein